MYRRIAFAAATLSLAAGGLLVLRAWLRPYQDLQRRYGATLGIAGLLAGGVLLGGAVSISASAGQPDLAGLRPRWPVLLGVVVIALIIAGVGMAAAVAITSPDPQPGPVRAPDQPNPVRVPDTVPRRPPS